MKSFFTIALCVAAVSGCVQTQAETKPTVAYTPASLIDQCHSVLSKGEAVKFAQPTYVDKDGTVTVSGWREIHSMGMMQANGYECIFKDGKLTSAR